MAGPGAAAYVDKSPALNVFVDEEQLSLEALLGRLIPPPGWVAWASTINSSVVGGYYMLTETPEFDITCPPKFGVSVSTVKQRKMERAGIADDEFGSSSEMPMGVKESETALKHFGFNAYRQRNGGWKNEVDNVIASGIKLYPEGILPCSGQGVLCMLWTGAVLIINSLYHAQCWSYFFRL